MVTQSQYIKTSVVINKILELEAERYYGENKELIDAQITILKEILKPQ